MRVVIVDHDSLFRAELHNFLLSAGFAHVSVVSKLPEPLGEIAMQDILLLDEGAWPPRDGVLLRRIRRIAPRSLIVSMIRSPGRAPCAEHPNADPRVRYMVKTDFSRSLLPLLTEAEGGDAP